MPPGGCPEPSALDRLNEGVVSPKDESALVEHLRICQACCRRFGDIVSAWSVATKAQNGRRAPTDADRAILDRLAAYGPEDAVPPPVIEGLSDLVEVGRGGMGVVYRAKEARLGRTVAVKVLHRRSSKEGESLARAEREARLLTKIAHPNVVGILYVTDVDRAPAIVMEWIEGPSLETRAEEGPIPSREAVSIVAAVARGLVAVHAGGVIHRDIKPPNVLLARASDAGGFTPKLVDFGLAMPHGDTEDRVTRASMAVGTPSFMAPEQTGLDPALGPVGPAADVHALGGVLYWLLCGKKPHEGRTTAERRGLQRTPKRRSRRASWKRRSAISSIDSTGTSSGEAPGRSRQRSTTTSCMSVSKVCSPSLNHALRSTLHRLRRVRSWFGR